LEGWPVQAEALKAQRGCWRLPVVISARAQGARPACLSMRVDQVGLVYQPAALLHQDPRREFLASATRFRELDVASLPRPLIAAA